jgi:hypothetical protein
MSAGVVHLMTDRHFEPKSRRMMVPKTLYKYCSLNATSLNGILRRQPWHSPSKWFEDPLDCKPSLIADIPADELVELLRKLLSDTGLPEDEIELRIKKIAYESKTADLAGRRARPVGYLSLLAEAVRDQLHGQLGARGVLSLSERWDEPLMWSQYADQHRGVCLEFEVDSAGARSLRPVDYAASRAVRASDAYDWRCTWDEEAGSRVADTFFYSKASPWSYEKEWRDVRNEADSNPARFTLSAVHLGFRTEPAWRTIVLQALQAQGALTIYEIRVNEDRFALHRHVLAGDMSSDTDPDV